MLYLGVITVIEIFDVLISVVDRQVSNPLASIYVEKQVPVPI
jgi:hypothetical protein